MAWVPSSRLAFLECQFTICYFPTVYRILALTLLLLAPNVLAQQVQNPPPPANTPEIPQTPTVDRDIELNTVLMESTFLIEGPVGQGKTLGTVFIIAQPIPNTTPEFGQYVMITAAHVLQEMQGNFAILHLRHRVDEKTNTWVQVPYQLQIRSNGQPLWTKHPEADVAAMYISVPLETAFKPVTTRMLVDDQMLSDFGIHPGDEVRCLGYPLGATSNDAGFPVLRSGKIASYPLTPTGQTKTFLFDFRVFKGNSGGPVYFVEKNRPMLPNFGRFQSFHFIMGLVTDEKLFTEQAVGQYSQEIRQTQLGLAIVVHASLIKQTIDMLPMPAKSK
jgi:hypothetical protein